MSLGMRSGVNWMRLKLSVSVSARLRTSSVFASPGTPTSRQWPRANRLTSNSRMIASCPTITLPSSAVIRV